LNEGFKCNCIKTNKYVIFVLCVSDSYVSQYSNIWWLVECCIGQVIEPTFGDKLTRVN